MKLLRYLGLLSKNISQDSVEASKQLVDAIQANDELSVQLLLWRKNLDFSVRNSSQKTPLHVAVQNNNENIVKILLAFGADPNIKDGRGNTPLHCATLKLNVNLMHLLLEAGADVNAANKELKTALHFAAEVNNNDAIIELLLNNNASIDREDKKYRTPLKIAVAYRIIENIVLLLNYGANPSAIHTFEDYHLGFLPRDQTRVYPVNKKLICALLLKDPDCTERYFYYNNSYLSNLWKQCQQEIELEISQLEQIGFISSIYGNLTLWDLYKNADEKVLAAFVQNKAFMQQLKAIDLQQCFPLSAEKIVFNIQRGNKQAKLFSAALEVMNKIQQLNEDCWRNILQRVNTEDLKNIVKASTYVIEPDVNDTKIMLNPLLKSYLQVQGDDLTKQAFIRIHWWSKKTCSCYIKPDPSIHYPLWSYSAEQLAKVRLCDQAPEQLHEKLQNYEKKNFLQRCFLWLFTDIKWQRTLYRYYEGCIYFRERVQDLTESDQTSILMTSQNLFTQSEPYEQLHQKLGQDLYRTDQQFETIIKRRSKHWLKMTFEAQLAQYEAKREKQFIKKVKKGKKTLPKDCDSEAVITRLMEDYHTYTHLQREYFRNLFHKKLPGPFALTVKAGQEALNSYLMQDTDKLFNFYVTICMKESEQQYKVINELQDKFKSKGDFKGLQKLSAFLTQNQTLVDESQALFKEIRDIVKWNHLCITTIKKNFSSQPLLCQKIADHYIASTKKTKERLSLLIEKWISEHEKLKKDLLPFRFNYNTFPPEKNRYFIPRVDAEGEDYLKVIGDSFNQVEIQKRITLYGLPGTGKTELALAYFHNTEKKYKVRLWFNAESRDSLLQQYRELGEELKLFSNSKITLQKKGLRVRNYLGFCKDWLIVYDNAPNHAEIKELFPVDLGPHVIVTTRYSEGWSNPTSVDVFQRSESIQYIEKTMSKTISNAERTSANQLAEALGDVPLALEQTISYLQQENVAIVDYSKRYLNKKTEILTYDSSKLTVYKICGLIREEIKKRSPLAANWLESCSYLAAHAIPEFLLKTFAEYPKNNPKKESPGEGLVVLEWHSLLKFNEDTRCASINSLLQEVIRIQLEEKEKRSFKTLRIITKLLHTCFPIEQACLGITSDPELQKQLLPHFEAVLGHLNRLIVTSKYWRTLFFQHTIYQSYLYFSLERVDLAENLLERMLAIQKYYAPSKHTVIMIDTLIYLGLACQILGNTAKAHQLFQQAFTIYKQSSQKCAAETLINLANVAFFLGDLHQAYGLFEQAIKRLCHSNKPFELARAIIDLSKVKYCLGEVEHTSPLIEQIISIYEAKLGANHKIINHTLQYLTYNNYRFFNKPNPTYPKHFTFVFEKKVFC